MKVCEIDISQGFVDELAAFRPRVAFLALHGGFGEDGRIQKVLEAQGVKYTGAGPLASLVAMDKEISKRAFAGRGLPTPACRFLSRGASLAEVEGAVREVGFPCMVKPTAQGSSRGVSLARRRLAVLRGLEDAFRYSRRAMIEEFVEGREINVAILDGRVLPLVEVVAEDDEFFSYRAKYESKATRYVVDPFMSRKTQDTLKKIALTAYEAFRCRHLARVEIILAHDGRPYLIEVNTLPGMTTHSLFPMAARAAGMSMEEVCVKIAKMAMEE
jgi:D-alanine--D-alanine ligase